MDSPRLAENILLHIDWMLFIPVIFVLLLLYLIFRGRFQLDPDFLKYARYCFFLLFYSIAAFGFIMLNAIDLLFHRANRFVIPPYILIVPYSLLSGLVGSLVGYLLYHSARKIAPRAVYMLLNASLVIVALPLTWLLILQPLNEAITYVDPNGYHFNRTGIKVNICGLVKKDIDEAKHINERDFAPSTPYMRDRDYNISGVGSYELFIVRPKDTALAMKKNGWYPIHDIYTGRVSVKGQACLAVLSMLTPTSGYSVFYLFDEQLNCVYEEVFDDYIWGMQCSSRQIILRKHKMTDNGYAEQNWFVYE